MTSEVSRSVLAPLNTADYAAVRRALKWLHIPQGGVSAFLLLVEDKVTDERDWLRATERAAEGGGRRRATQPPGG